jgi:hypothetical protein
MVVVWWLYGGAKGAVTQPFMVGGHAKTAFLHAGISAAAHQRQRRHGLKKKSTAQIRLRRILENTVRVSKSLSVYCMDPLFMDLPYCMGSKISK